MSAERRRGPRRRALLLAQLRLAEDRRIAGLVYDVGDDGMCVLCDPPPEFGARADTGDDRPIGIDVEAANGARFEARLVNRHGCRFGVRFDAVDDDARALLHDCLHAHPAGA